MSMITSKVSVGRHQVTMRLDHEGKVTATWDQPPEKITAEELRQYMEAHAALLERMSVELKEDAL